MLMGVVIVQAVSYCRYARTDKKHIVAIVVSQAFLLDRPGYAPS
jgi:hypothetical protein